MKRLGKLTVGLAALIIAAGLVTLSCTGTPGRGDAGFNSSHGVVIIGAGGAGLSAAIAAREAGADVVIFEKMGMVGGNTVRATGGMNAAGTVYQARAGITDSAALFYDDTMRGGGYINDSVLVRLLADQSASAISWLSGMGADLSDVGRLGGASVNRAHRPTGGAMVGPEVTAALHRQVVEVLGIPLILNAEVTAITSQGGRVTGVVVSYRGRRHRVSADAVILASGGFGANNSMAAALVPSLRGFATTNQPGATGEGIRMAQRAGAALVDMEQIQTHPTHAPDREMITEAVRGNGAIMTSREGLRFVDEMGFRDLVSERILAQPGGSAFLVFDDSVRRSLAAIESYIRRGFVYEAATPEALGALLGAADGGAAMARTIAVYNQAFASGNDGEFGRTSMARSLSVPPFYAIEVVPAIHHTMGGVHIDTETRVLSAAGTPIPGFYAAGEAVGGIHGNNRLGGNAMIDIIVFGRIAGLSAATGR
ncbi:MAG: flavocytochrome c [Treponema sp.]|nr:flavocytochrome c [Treponema sp.]